MQKKDLFKKILEDNKLSKDEMRDVILAKAEMPVRKKSLRRRLVIILACVLAMFTMAGAAGYWLEVVTFDMDGKMRIHIFDGNSSFFEIEIAESPADAEQIEFERAFYQSEENVARFITEDYTVPVMQPYSQIEDFEELQKYMDGDIFKLPQYIPGGYEFLHANITYFLDDSLNFDDAELLFYEEKFGRIYEKYRFPESQQKMENVGQIEVVYTNGNDRSISYGIQLSYTDLDNIFYIGLDSVEPLNLPQLEKSIFTTRSYEYNGENYINYTFKGGKTCEPRYFMEMHNLSETFRASERYKQLDGGTPKAYGVVTYDILFLDSPEEIKKMAESIK